MTLWNELLGSEVRFYDVNGVRTRCIQAGTGPALIFLHGGGGHAEAFARNVVSLSDRFRVVALDYLGFGLTDKPATLPTLDDYVDHLLGFMDAAGISSAHLAGESLGGWVTMWTAIRHPERVDKLVNICGARLTVDTSEASREHVAQGLDELRSLTRQAALEPSRESVRRRMEWLFHDPEVSLDDELVELRWRLYQSRQVSGLYQAATRDKETVTTTGGVFSQDGTDLDVEALGRITQPTLFIWTSHNPTTTAETARNAAAHVPDSEFVLMEGCGHWPQWEDTKTFNAAITEFLTR